MISMKISIIFFISVIFSCIFFTAGRWVGKEERDFEIKSASKKSFKNVKKISKNHCENDKIIDAVYEDVIDLSEYRERLKSKDVSKIIKYEWMYSKKDNAYVKVPRDIAEIIKRMKEDI